MSLNFKAFPLKPPETKIIIPRHFKILPGLLGRQFSPRYRGVYPKFSEDFAEFLDNFAEFPEVLRWFPKVSRSGIGSCLEASVTHGVVCNVFQYTTGGRK